MWDRSGRTRSAVGVVVAVILELVLGVGGAPAGFAAAPDSDPHYEYHYDFEATPRAWHELHETYADLAIEGGVVGARFLFFQEQLEAAVGQMLDADAVALRPGAEADALVLRYVRERVAVAADDVALEPSLLDSGQERLGHHMGWWVTVQYQAEAAVTELRIRNTLLFEVHDDQQNRMKVAWFPDGLPQTYTTMAGQAEVIVSR